MPVEGVFEPLANRHGKAFHLFLGQGHIGHNFVKQGMAQERAHVFIRHAFAHRVQPGHVGRQHHGGVGAVEHADFTQLVGLYVIGKNDGVHFVQGQFVFHTFGPFDHPQAKGLGGDQLLVFIADFFKNAGHFIAGEAGDDAVHQGGTENVFFFDPADERIPQVPLGRGFQNGFLQEIAVIVDQFAGKQDEALLFQQEALVHKPGQLAGEGSLGSIVVTVLAGVDNAGFGGVGYDEAQIVIFCQGQVLVKFLIDLYGIDHAAHNAGLFHVAFFFTAPEHHGVQVILLPQHIHHTSVQRLGNANAHIGVFGIVQVINHFIHEGAQKIAFAKLQYTDFSGTVYIWGMLSRKTIHIFVLQTTKNFLQ